MQARHDSLLKFAAQGRADCVMLIACSKSKGSEPSIARKLYKSPLFRKSAHIAERLGSPYYILSAKHGLVEPDSLLEPYDFSLRDLPEIAQAEWAERVAAEISLRIPLGTKQLCLLSGRTYSSHLTALLTERGFEVLTELAGLSIGRRLAKLTAVERILDRRLSIEQFYSLLGELANRNGLFPLNEFPHKKVCQQGVYFFFDPAEPTEFSTRLPRLARVGTHAVSRGSVATLRQRLRAHYGLAEGGGNHRASIFRLHVGRALLRRSNVEHLLPSWGKDQSAPAGTRALENEHEERTSKYLRGLHLTFLEVLDEASSTNMRSYIERNSIALFTESGVVPDLPSQDWLGHYSDRDQISSSGLWNVRHVGEVADPSFLRLVERLVYEKQLV